MNNNTFKIIAILLLVGFATWKFLTSPKLSETYDPKIYFYDISAQELFKSDQSNIPPIQGIDNDEMDGVRAVVIESSSFSGRKIAYLEKFSNQLKTDIEKSRLSEASGEVYPRKISRSDSKGHIFVRRADEEKWYSMNSKEGNKIVSEWQIEDSEGNMPVIVNP